MGHPRILYALTPFSGPSGGIRTLFEHVSVLREAGYNAYIFAPGVSQVRRGFASDAPILEGKYQPLYQSNIIVRPETSYAHGIAQIGRRLRQILFVQNQFYIRHSFGAHRRLSDLGIERVICVSRGIQRFLAEHAGISDAWIIPNAISVPPQPPTKRLAPKQLTVAAMKSR
jgi:hypothetical protein